MSDWEAVKARLDCWLRGDPVPTDLVYADIRAALERAEELEVDADHEQGLRWLAEKRVSELSALHIIEWRKNQKRVQELERERMTPGALLYMDLAKRVFARILETPVEWAAPEFSADIDLRAYACIERAKRAEAAEAKLQIAEDGLRATADHRARVEAMLDIANRKLVECGEVWDAQEAKLTALQQLAEIRLQESMRQEMAKEEAETKLAEAEAECARHKRNAECYACEAGDPDMDGVQDTKLSRAEAEVARLRAALDDMMRCSGDSRPSVRRGAYERAQRILAPVPEVKP